MGKAQQKLAHFLKENEIITTEQAEKMGIGRNELSLEVKKKSLFRLERGVYAKTPDILFEPIGAFVPALLKMDYGVICLISALRLYELTDEMGEEKWIAIPNEKVIKPFSNIKIIRLRGINYSMGISMIQYKKYKLKIYDPEKTIIDTFKYLPQDTAIKALREYLKRKDKKIEKLIQYGRKLRYDITNIITALVTT